MAELDQVYGSMSETDMQQYEDEKHNDYQGQQGQQDYANTMQQPVQQPQQMQQPMVQNMQPVVQQNVQPRRQMAPTYSFWDRMALKRNDVIKLAVFSLVILLAIALDKICTFYLTTYLSENSLSASQEFMMRMSYPVIIFLIIWVMKSL
jgi:hypothetical protein